MENYFNSGMDYLNYLCEDFLENTSFQSFVKGQKKEDVVFWESWIKSHPEKHSEVNLARDILLGLSSQKQLTKSISKEEELKKLLNSITAEEVTDRFDPGKGQVMFNFVRIAAIAILLIGFGVGLRFLVFNKKQGTPTDLAYKVLSTPRGKRMKITLPDSTKIWLNSESTLRYSNDFDDIDRKVYLTGEAYFDVTENKSKPFYVYASEIRVKVLGTAFNVKSYPEDNYVETTLERGKIHIERLDEKHKKDPIIALDPNQKVILYKSGFEPVENHVSSRKKDKIEKITTKQVVISNNVRTDLYTSWRNEKLIFRSEPLGSLKSRMERWYNIPIVVKDTGLYKKKFTGTFVNEPIQQALKAFCVASELNFKIQNDTVYLMPETKN